MESIREITTEEYDPLSNVMIKTKQTVEQLVPRGHDKDSALNYGG